VRATAATDSTYRSLLLGPFLGIFHRDLCAATAAMDYTSSVVTAVLHTTALQSQYLSPKDRASNEVLKKISFAKKKRRRCKTLRRRIQLNLSK